MKIKLLALLLFSMAVGCFGQASPTPTNRTGLMAITTPGAAEHTTGIQYYPDEITIPPSGALLMGSNSYVPGITNVKAQSCPLMQMGSYNWTFYNLIGSHTDSQFSFELDTVRKVIFDVDAGIQFCVQPPYGATDAWYITDSGYPGIGLEHARYVAVSHDAFTGTGLWLEHGDSMFVTGGGNISGAMTVEADNAFQVGGAPGISATIIVSAPQTLVFTGGILTAVNPGLMEMKIKAPVKQDSLLSKLSTAVKLFLGYFRRP